MHKIYVAHSFMLELIQLSEGALISSGKIHKLKWSSFLFLMNKLPEDKSS